MTWWGTVFSCWALLGAGCQTNSSPPPELVSLEILVSLDDRPLVDALVILLPQRQYSVDGQYFPWSFGQTDETGRAILRTSEQTAGALAGTHRVIVSKRSEQPPREPEFNLFDDLFRGRAFGRPIDRDVSSETLPARFNSDSVIALDVTPGMRSPVELKLQSE